MSVTVMFRIPTIYDEEQPEGKLLLFPRMKGTGVTESSESHTTVRPTVSMAIVPSVDTVTEHSFAQTEAGDQPFQYLGSFRDHSQRYASLSISGTATNTICTQTLGHLGLGHVDQDVDPFGHHTQKQTGSSKSLEKSPRRSSNSSQESAVTPIRADSEHTAFIGSLPVSTEGKHPVFFSKVPIRDSNELPALREMERIDVSCNCLSSCQRKGCPCRNLNGYCSLQCTCGTKKKCENRINGKVGQQTTKNSNERKSPKRSAHGKKKKETAGCISEPQQITQAPLVDVKAKLAKLTHDELTKLCEEFFSTRVSLFQDWLLRKDQGDPPHSLSGPVEIPKWCKCRKCQEMPTQKERKCCGRKRCITLDHTFYEICLNGQILEVAIRSQADVYVEYPTYDNRNMRHIGYRQFVMWQHGPLGAGNRVVIPSCCVWSIRQHYSSPDGRYTGYKDKR